MVEHGQWGEIMDSGQEEEIDRENIEEFNRIMKYQVGRGTSRIILLNFSWQEQSLDKMAQHPAQLDFTPG